MSTAVFGLGDRGVAGDGGCLGGDGARAVEDSTGVSLSGEDVRGDDRRCDGDGDGDVLERGEMFRSICPSLSRSNSTSHRRFAALVRLAGGEAAEGGEGAGDGVEGGCGAVGRVGRGRFSRGEIGSGGSAHAEAVAVRPR